MKSTLTEHFHSARTDVQINELEESLESKTLKVEIALSKPRSGKRLVSTQLTPVYKFHTPATVQGKRKYVANAENC